MKEWEKHQSWKFIFIVFLISKYYISRGEGNYFLKIKWEADSLLFPAALTYSFVTVDGVVLGADILTDLRRNSSICKWPFWYWIMTFWARLWVGNWHGSKGLNTILLLCHGPNQNIIPIFSVLSFYLPMQRMDSCGSSCFLSCGTFFTAQKRF